MSMDLGEVPPSKADTQLEVRVKKDFLYPSKVAAWARGAFHALSGLRTRGE